MHNCIFIHYFRLRMQIYTKTIHPQNFLWISLQSFVEDIRGPTSFRRQPFSNNLRIWFWHIPQSVNEIRQSLKVRLYKKEGNLNFGFSCNSLWVNTFYHQPKCRLFGFSLQSCLTETVMSGNKKPPWGPGPPALQAPPSSAEGGKSPRWQPCCKP